MRTNSDGTVMQNRVFLWLAIAVGIVLLIPLIAMQFTNEVDWGPEDFIVIGVLLFGTGSLFVLTARKVRETSQRLALGIVLAVALLYVWAELAVGVFTDLGS
jgi:hypothetical protein